MAGMYGMPAGYGAPGGTQRFSPRYRRSTAAPAADSYGGYPGVGQGVYDMGSPGASYATAGAPSPYGGTSAPQSNYSTGRWGPNVNTQPSAALGGYEGYGAGNAFIGPGGTFSGNQGVGAVIPDFYRQGAFDPSGGGAYLDAIKAELGAREQSDVAQAGLTSDLYGGDDPLSRMYGRLTAEQ